MYEEIKKELQKGLTKKELKEDFLVDVDKEKARKKGQPQGAAPDFGKAIKIMLIQNDMSESELSKKTGINEKSIRSIENHSTINPSYDVIERLATAFEMPFFDFIGLAWSSYKGNRYLTQPTDRRVITYELDKGFSLHAMTPPGMSKRDFFIGIITIQGDRKLNYWKFPGSVAKACIQPWDGKVIFTHHGMNWKEEEHVAANATLYFDPCIPHSFENPSPSPIRMLLTTYPSLF